MKEKESVELGDSDGLECNEEIKNPFLRNKEKPFEVIWRSNGSFVVRERW